MQREVHMSAQQNAFKNPSSRHRILRMRSFTFLLILLAVSAPLSNTGALQSVHADAVVVSGIEASVLALTPEQEPTPLPEPPIITVPAQQSPPTEETLTTTSRRQIRAEMVTIRPRGFNPTTITRPVGPFLLAVHNRSGLRSVTLRLDPEVGPRLREVQVPREQLDWRAVVDLPPGQYRLTEANHPRWLCRIVITPR